MDPYKVLGVSPSSSDDEIKKAYRDMVKKYHPDRYANAPKNMQDQASERIKQINAAYDQIQNMRSGKADPQQSGGYGGGYGGYGGYGGGYNRGYGGSYAGPTGNESFEDIRQMISMGLVMQAEQALLRMSVRPAQWHYLYGLVNMRKGYYTNAKESFEQACRMEPNNQEYRQALDQMEGVFQQTRGRTSGRNMNQTLCQLCQCMACMSVCGGRFCMC